MPAINVKVSGLAETHQLLTRVKVSLEDGQLVGKVAAIVQGQAMKNASGRPGPNVQTGRLRSSIATRVTGLYSAVVGPSAYYAPFVEFGHSQKAGRYVPAIGKRLVKSFAPAYPFMIPAIAQTSARIKDFVVNWIKKAVKGSG